MPHVFKQAYTPIYNPVNNRIAARQDSGIILIKPGISNNDTKSISPCTMALTLVRAPALTLADERTITAVIGKPPSKPLTKLPAPCATSSRFVGDIRLIGSILSTASKLSKVSKLATTAMVKAVIQTCLLPMALKFGI
jgi:hypothetical protein